MSATLVAIAIASVRDDAVVRAVSGWIGFGAAAAAFVLMIAGFSNGRKECLQHHQTRSGLGEERVMVNDAPTALFQAALALTIKQLDGIDPGDRTAERFRSNMHKNLSALVDDDTERLAREAVEKVIAFSR